jgi:hypothetical protein
MLTANPKAEKREAAFSSRWLEDRSLRQISQSGGQKSLLIPDGSGAFLRLPPARLRRWPHDFQVILRGEGLDLLQIRGARDLLKELLEACWGNNNQYFG